MGVQVNPEEIIEAGGPKVKQDYPNHRKYFLERMIRENQYKIGAELGVQYGFTYCHLIETFDDLTMLGVDTWSAKHEMNLPISDTGESLNKEMYCYLLEWSKDYGDRVNLIRDYTTEAVKTVPDGSLDFVFVDAGHSFDCAATDIKEWTPKVRSGGMVAGHDVDELFVRTALSLYHPKYSIANDNCWYVIV